MPETNDELQKALEMLRDVYARQIPFNRVLGLEITAMDLEQVCVRLDMQEKLIGNFIKGSLHGGVVASVMDLTGGIVAGIGLVRQLAGASTETIFERIARVGTIDLRVDYLRPGRGRYFLTEGAILRSGSKVAVARMEMRNDEEKLIAVGTGTYIVG